MDRFPISVKRWGKDFPEKWRRADVRARSPPLEEEGTGRVLNFGWQRQRLPMRWWQEISKKWAPRTHDNTPTEVESDSCSAPYPVRTLKSVLLQTRLTGRREEDGLAFGSCVSLPARCRWSFLFFGPVCSGSSIRLCVYKWKPLLFVTSKARLS